MESTHQPAAHAAGVDADDQFPTLRKLGCSVEELTVLRRQGYLSQDHRLAGRTAYWRLRFRHRGRLRTVFVGNDEQQLTRVRMELAQLRAARVHALELIRAVRQGRAALRKAKAQLAPVLLQFGIHYHGDTVRRFRRLPTMDMSSR